MDDDEFEKVIKAGKIASEARNYAAGLIKPGAKVLDVCEEAERAILSKGAKPAFPCNLSINDEAAHYSPLINDEKIIPEGSVVKLDIGAHIDGYVVDTAVTVSLSNKYDELRLASLDALEAAIANFRAGIRVGELGHVIERTIKSRGFKPIWNLGGHLIRRYVLHAGVFIPNVSQRDPNQIRPDETYAIEPFATTGRGEVKEGKQVTIYSLRTNNVKKIGKEEEELITVIQERFSTLPFNERWLADKLNVTELRGKLSYLAKKGILTAYPVLLEVNGGTVSQHEHTLIDRKGEIVVVTK
ncbi:type II methionyl aminopeptidase [Sulfolobales archaeon HS-7]|nr:type II methionyl aminopeptidase [Sulfolobales archaeon HS-7]